jgi:DNA-directed RNA polymerase sigma subunit (sigma70/sigma32)
MKHPYLTNNPGASAPETDIMLTSNERQVLQMRFGLGTHDPTGLTLVEIARQLGVTPQRASQIESSALAKMRAALQARGIESMDDVV